MDSEAWGGLAFGKRPPGIDSDTLCLTLLVLALLNVGGGPRPLTLSVAPSLPSPPPADSTGPECPPHSDCQGKGAHTPRPIPDAGMGWGQGGQGHAGHIFVITVV